MELLARPIGVVLFAVAAGCASAPESPQRQHARTGLLIVDASLMVLPAAAPIVVSPEADPIAVVPEADPIAVVPEAAPMVAPPRIKAPAKAASPAVPVVEAAKQESPVPDGARDVEPLLDVASLKARLRETTAIGTLTKLSLRNQMDELVKQFRAQHLSGLIGGVASMRQPYDALVLKVLAAVREGDPSLARLITDSREALWELLADPRKFASIT